jgi:hypothetical protein
VHSPCPAKGREGPSDMTQETALDRDNYTAVAIFDRQLAQTIFRVLTRFGSACGEYSHMHLDEHSPHHSRYIGGNTCVGELNH